MIKNRDAYFTVSEFSKLCGVNKQTLHFYDHIGLFSPEYVDQENGYRYYSPPQYNTFKAITALRDIGTTIEELKKYMAIRNPDAMIELYNKKAIEVSKKIKRLTRISKTIEIQTSVTRASQCIRASDFQFETRGEETIIISDPINAAWGSKNIYSIFASHDTYCAENDYNDGYLMGTIVPNSHLVDGSFDVQYFFTQTNNMAPSPKSKVKAQGLYVVGYYKGPFNDIVSTYHKLLEYVGQHHFKIVGDAYEYTYLDYLAEKKRRELYHRDRNTGSGFVTYIKI